LAKEKGVQLQVRGALLPPGVRKEMEYAGREGCGGGGVGNPSSLKSVVDQLVVRVGRE